EADVAGFANRLAQVELLVGDAVALPRRLELEQVVVQPAEHRLNDVVQLPERDRGRHLDPPPDRGPELQQADVQASDGGHGVQFQGSSSARRRAGWLAMRAMTSVR